MAEPVRYYEGRNGMSTHQQLALELAKRAHMVEPAYVQER